MENNQPKFHPGDKIGKYVVLSELGTGSLSTIYLAEQQFTHRKVALKFFETRDEEFLTAAHREAELLASMEHPYIVRMYDADEYDGWFYLIVEFIEGKSIGDMIEARDSVPLEVALKLMVDIAEALEYAHHLGVVHGDIIPNNIIVSPKGVPFLMDFFASAAIVGRGTDEPMVGTPPYMSPETWRGEYASVSDLWSLGMTFYHLLAGRLPFDPGDYQGIIQAVTSAETLDFAPLRSIAPEPVSRIIERCLQKRIEDRYTSAAELCRDGQAALAYLAQRQTDQSAGADLALQSGLTVMLTVEYKEPGIAGQYREYRIEKELGQGSFSHVFQAQDVICDRKVALKILRQERAKDEKVLSRFRREAGLLARLEHPNIVRVYNFGQYGLNYFIVMEVLSGLTLKQVLARENPLSVEQAVAVMSQVLTGLEKLHAENIIHRDLKPDNIKLLPDRAVVMDLGLAHVNADTQLTRSGEMFGTPRYMSPEQARGEKTNFQSDLYAVGVILYELLTGKTPHETESLASLLFKIAVEEPRPITDYRVDLPELLVLFLERILARESDRRFSSTAVAHGELLASLGLQHDDVAAIYAQISKNLFATE